jgi:hypothetical protein
MADRYFRLKQFLGSYFHQDWVLEAQNADEVLHRYAKQESEDMRLAIVSEIAELLQANDQVLRDTIQDSGFCYDPSVEGMSVRQWLGKTLEVLRGQ